MAKVHHNNFIDTINEISAVAREKGVVHLVAEDKEFTGRHLHIDGQKLVNFGTCGYLGLEMDERLINGSIEFTKLHGTQFSVSRTFLSSGYNVNLEQLLNQIYKKPIITYSSTSTAHISVIPTIIKETDAIILDQQVHMSVQTAVQLVQTKGVAVEMIRHSNLDMLERQILKIRDKHQKIWYMIDGVYSMYGDVAPMKELMELCKKYEQLHLYIDDAHGMSWYGKHGAGYVFEEAGVTDQMILITTLAKGFGTVGGIAVFPNKEEYERVKYFGGPLTYSHPLPAPILGAAIASAKIHLSDEIYDMQMDLHGLLTHCNAELEKTELPVISNPATPIYFIGMGHPRVGYNIVKRLLDNGFFCNIGIFPAVPLKNTGLRFTINRHLKKEDITEFINAIAYHFPKAISEEKRTENEIRKAFRLPEKMTVHHNGKGHQIEEIYEVQHVNTIKDIDKQEWNNIFEELGFHTHEGLQAIEEAFTGNELPEDNWEFHYFIIRGDSGKILLATFFTVGIFKDDLLAPPSVSLQVEEKRMAGDPYYLTSTTMGMGTLVSDGQHMYINQDYPHWHKVLHLLLEEVNKLQDATGADNIYLRDFEEDEKELTNFLLEEGYAKVTTPSANVIDNLNQFKSEEEYLASFNYRKRRKLKNEVFAFEHLFVHEIKKELSDIEIDLFHQLYLNVKENNFSVNYYPYPRTLIKAMSVYPEWEFSILRIAKGTDAGKIASMVACFNNGKQYSPLIIGMDYKFLHTHKLYKQSLYRVVRRAIELGAKRMNLGVTADMEKRKVGAKSIPRIAFMQARDNFHFEVLETMSAVKME